MGDKKPEPNDGTQDSAVKNDPGVTNNEGETSSINDPKPDRTPTTDK